MSWSNINKVSWIDILSPALPQPVLLHAAAIGHLFAVKHQGIFETDLTGIIRLQSCDGGSFKKQKTHFIRWIIRRNHSDATPLLASLTCLSVEKFLLAVHTEQKKKVTKCYSAVMFPPTVQRFCCPASLRASQTATNTTCNPDSSLKPLGGTEHHCNRGCDKDNNTFLVRRQQQRSSQSLS